MLRHWIRNFFERAVKQVILNDRTHLVQLRLLNDIVV